MAPGAAYRLRSQLHEPYTLGFDENEIAFSTPAGKQKLPWSLYRGWLLDLGFVFLSLGRGHATVIPRRALNGEAAEQRFLALVERKLGPERGATKRGATLRSFPDCVL